MQVELADQKQSVEDTAKYVDGTMAEANLHITEWEENQQTLKDLATRAKGDTLQMINAWMKLMKDTGVDQANFEAIKATEKEWFADYSRKILQLQGSRL